MIMPETRAGNIWKYCKDVKTERQCFFQVVLQICKDAAS